MTNDLGRAGRAWDAPLRTLAAEWLCKELTALERQLESASGFEDTLALWRLSVARAALSFVEALIDRRTAEPIVYRPIGYVRSPHSTLHGMPLQAIAYGSSDAAI